MGSGICLMLSFLFSFSCAIIVRVFWVVPPVSTICFIKLLISFSYSCIDGVGDYTKDEGKGECIIMFLFKRSFLKNSAVLVSWFSIDIAWGSFLRFAGIVIEVFYPFLL